jgi:hypothetical protein
VGLAAGGAIATATRERALQDSVHGTAMIEILANRDGTIRDARLLRASEDPAGWERFARSLRGMPAPRTRLPEQAAGLWLRLGVTADTRWPSGNRVGHPIRWYPGIFFGFDVMDISHRTPVRVANASVLSEVWY